jgi:FkbM family methyltransferase
MAIVSLTLTINDRALSFDMDDRERKDYVVFAALKDGLACYEEPFPAYLAGLLARLKGTFLDVGANTGLYALLAAAVDEQVMVQAFEPVDTVADGFMRNAGINPQLGPRLTLNRLALTDFTGEALFHETSNPHFMTTTSGLNAEFSKAHGETRHYLVPAMTLDAFMTENPIEDLSFIKIDVEGHEKEVLRGAEATILMRRPFIGVELLWDADYDFVERFLIANGYIDAILQPGTLRFTQFPEYIRDGWNHILVPEERRGLAEEVARVCGLKIIEG